MPKFDLIFNPPLMNAAGSMGYSPETRFPIDGHLFGAFVTNPVSLVARSPAHAPHYMEYNGGFLLHTGHPNPGLRQIIQRYAGSWRRSNRPVIVHLLCQHPDEVYAMSCRLEQVEGVAGLELGLPPDCDSATALAFIQAASQSGSGELPVLSRLALDRAIGLAPALIGAPIVAISLGPPRGMLLDDEGNLARGRLYGPSLFPIALATVHSLVQTGLPVVGAGGVYSKAQVQGMLDTGAIAVQLDAILWRNGWPPVD